ncbi:MAG: class I SAM-dependent methyltransferase [Oscillospiraceae bacterium]|nr:class I SAM-dependent methyltransferase [Oscillospiraceae bacterium]
MLIKNQKTFWNFYAPVYNIFMGINKKAYQEMYQKIRKIILKKQVLEVATGTGLIARNTAKFAKKYIATDFSENMLYQAQKGNQLENLFFMQADACALPFENNSFDVVIISNALHIMPNPEKALSEIARVLKTGGILIAPCLINQNINSSSLMLTKIFKTISGVTMANWNEKEYIQFLKNNRFHVKKKVVLKAMMPLLYTEAVYR